MGGETLKLLRLRRVDRPVTPGPGVDRGLLAERLNHRDPPVREPVLSRNALATVRATSTASGHPFTTIVTPPHAVTATAPAAMAAAIDSFIVVSLLEKNGAGGGVSLRNKYSEKDSLISIHLTGIDGFCIGSSIQGTRVLRSDSTLRTSSGTQGSGR